MADIERTGDRPATGHWSPIFGQWPEWLTHWPGHLVGAADDQIKIEQFTDDGTLVVKADLPGVDPKKDVEITIIDDRLVIRAQRRQESKSQDKNYFRSEIRYGAFSRSLPLPPGAKEDSVKATYKDGILEVRMPVSDKARTTKIPIVS